MYKYTPETIYKHPPGIYKHPPSPVPVLKQSKKTRVPSQRVLRENCALRITYEEENI